MALVRRSKKAVSDASGMMYSRAELFEMWIEWRATSGVSGTHESTGECSKDANAGTWNFTYTSGLSHCHVRITYHGIHIDILVDNQSKTGY